MSKKTIKKNIKLNNIKKKNKKDPRKNVMNTVKIIVGIVLVLVVFYMASGILTGQYKLTKKNTIDTSVILASKTFSQKNLEYYVIFYDFEGSDAESVKDIIDTNTAHTFYKVNIKSKLNSSYVSIFGNAGADNIEEFKVSSLGTTMVHVNDGHNAEYLEGIDQIKGSFN